MHETAGGGDFGSMQSFFLVADTTTRSHNHPQDSELQEFPFPDVYDPAFILPMLLKILDLGVDASIPDLIVSWVM